MNTQSKTLDNLPLNAPEQFESVEVLKKVAVAHRYLAELKGISASIPNEAILISTLTLQEAKHSSEIENIITTHDELYKAGLFDEPSANPAAKEVQNYAMALQYGFIQVRKNKLIRLTDILAIQQTMERNNAGLRKVPGTGLKNTRTGEMIYMPPQDANEIVVLMDNLVKYINDDSLCELDPLIKMAIIHHQFESIHPFYDGNGRTGRIIIILYLVAQDLLELPVLYLSSYIIQNKEEYYKQLQQAREVNDWRPWLIYMLDGVEKTAKNTIALIGKIKSLMQSYKVRMRNELPKIYRQELLNNLFSHPYTKIDFVMRDLGVSRITATKYLELLVKHEFLVKEKVGRVNFYINKPLFELFIAP